MRTLVLACAIAAPFVITQQPALAPPVQAPPAQPQPKPKDPTAIEPGGALANQIESLIRNAVALEKMRGELEAHARIAAIEARHKAEIGSIKDHIADLTREAHAGMYSALDSYLHEIGKNPFSQIDMLREQNRRLAGNR